MNGSSCSGSLRCTDRPSCEGRYEQQNRRQIGSLAFGEESKIFHRNFFLDHLRNIESRDGQLKCL